MLDPKILKRSHSRGDISTVIYALSEHLGLSASQIEFTYTDKLATSQHC